MDSNALTDSQLTTAEVIFEEFRDKDLQPAYLADADPNRALLDRYVLANLCRAYWDSDDDVYQACPTSGGQVVC